MFSFLFQSAVYLNEAFCLGMFDNNTYISDWDVILKENRDGTQCENDSIWHYSLEYQLL